MAGPRRHQGEDHAEHQGDGDHQRTTHRCGCIPGSAGRHGRAGPPAQPGAVLRRIYDKILYDGAVHVSTASLAPDVLCPDLQQPVQIPTGCGFRSGWVAISRTQAAGTGYIEGLDILANMRLCANVPGAARSPDRLGGYRNYQRSGHRRGACWVASLPRLGTAQRHPRRQLREADGRAVRLSRGSTEGSARSHNDESSSSTCCSRKNARSSGAPPSAGRGPTTSGWSPAPRR